VSAARGRGSLGVDAYTHRGRDGLWVKTTLPEDRAEAFAQIAAACRLDLGISHNGDALLLIVRAPGTDPLAPVYVSGSGYSTTYEGLIHVTAHPSVFREREADTDRWTAGMRAKAEERTNEVRVWQSLYRGALRAGAEDHAARMAADMELARVRGLGEG
jgi:hypothetical protein